MLATLDLPPSPASVGEARRFTVDTLTRWRKEDVTVTAALLVTELVTNAVLHARTAIQLRLERNDQLIRVAVRDGSLGRPAVRHHSIESTTGRGLALVGKLGRAWGVDLAADGKTVWVDIQRNADDQWSEDFAVVDDAQGLLRTWDDGEGDGAPSRRAGPDARAADPWSVRRSA